MKITVAPANDLYNIKLTNVVNNGNSSRFDFEASNGEKLSIEIINANKTGEIIKEIPFINGDYIYHKPTGTILYYKDDNIAITWENKRWYMKNIDNYRIATEEEIDKFDETFTKTFLSSINISND